jgi:carboxyl-terminal processing protease
MFGKLSDPPEAGADPKTGLVRTAKFMFKVRRGAIPLRVELETEEYIPSTVAGTVLRDDGTWDGMLDPLHRIGYVRVGAIESVRTTPPEIGSHVDAAGIVSDLAGRGCRGLVLDLRWCPGGYVDPGIKLAGMFLQPGTVVARVDLLPKVGGNLGGLHPTLYKAPATGPRFADLPLVVLVGPETVGGGELIAAALQENGRAVVCGQRTAGRAATQELISLGFDRLQFKATYGTSLRPSGRPRHRTPTSRPTDDWGIRPDPGLEVPVTPAVAARLRDWAEEQALRPAGSRAALPFDDPDRDPARAAALAHLRKQLGPPAGPAVQN